jgi:Zn-dependent peptidase ImmA (M78 family)/transcriptional regulator with XRE-family HTH domain
VQEFEPSRLIVARQRRGLTKKALAAKIGVTPPAITYLEEGKTQPSPHSLHSLANELGFSIDFFFAPDVPDIDPLAVSFRSRRSASAMLCYKTVAAGKLASSIVSPAINARFELPTLEVPDLSGEPPDVAARLLRNEWGLGNGPVTNMVHLLESRGVEVYWIDEESPSVDAVSFWSDGKPFVLLSSRTSGDRDRFNAAHELAHLVLHRHASVVDGREIEDEAQEFAANFLLPTTTFKQECPRLPVLEDFYPLKMRWGVSIQAMVRRGRDIGRFTSWQYECACKAISREGWRGRGKEAVSLPREESAVHTQVFGSLTQNGVTPYEFAKQVQLPEADLIELAPAAKAFRPSKSHGHLRMIG